MRTSSKQAIAGIFALTLLGVGCGPAPWVQGPADPAPREIEQGPAIVVVVPQSKAIPLPPTEVQDHWTPELPARPNPFERTRTWIGDYTCAQGFTGLAFRIVDVRGRVVRAIFDFHHAPSGAKGSYVVSGVYEPTTGKVAFEPGEWITQPEGYETVGMQGEVSRDGSLFAGRITHPSCGSFRLEPSR